MLRGYYLKGLRMLMLDPYLHFTPVYFSITKLSIRTLFIAKMNSLQID